MRIVKNIVILCFLGLLSMANVCNEVEFQYADITFENHSNECVYIVTSTHHPHDTTKFDSYWALEHNSPLAVPINSIRSVLGIMEQEWTFRLILFKQSTINNHTREEIIRNNLYDKYYDLSPEELDKLNYRIIYTGE